MYISIRFPFFSFHFHRKNNMHTISYAESNIRHSLIFQGNQIDTQHCYIHIHIHTYILFKNVLISWLEYQQKSSRWYIHIYNYIESICLELCTHRIEIESLPSIRSSNNNRNNLITFYGPISHIKSLRWIDENLNCLCFLKVCFE